MSFGFSVGDITALTGLAWRTVQKCRKAGSQHGELTDQVTSVHLVLQRLEREMLASNSTMQGIDDTYRGEIGKILRRCQKPLRLMDKLLERYNGLRDGKKNVKDLYQRVRFSNGEVGDLQELRNTLTHQTNALTLYLNIIMIGASGRVEKQLNESGKEMREMKTAVNGIAASVIMKAPKEGSILTSHTQDDGEVWRKFRRAMISKGFKSSFLQKHESLIQAYLEELSNSGALDDPDLTADPPKEAHPSDIAMNMADVQPERLVNKDEPEIDTSSSREKHKKPDSQCKDDKSVREKVTNTVLLQRKASAGSVEPTPKAVSETSSRPEKVSYLQCMCKKEPPLSIWRIRTLEDEKNTPWATKQFLSTWKGRLYLRLLHYKRTHAVSLSPFIQEPPYSFYLKIESRESLDHGNSLSPAGIPLQLAMNAPWAKPGFWLHSKGEALQNWWKWQIAHGSNVDRTYVETSQTLEQFFLASPWGICVICRGYNVSLLFADLEFVIRVVGHAEWQHLYCMGPNHRHIDIWDSIDSMPHSVTRFLSGSAKWLVPTMEYLLLNLTECLTSEEDVSPWAAAHSAEEQGSPTIENVHGLACLSFVANSLRVDRSSSFEVEGFRDWMARIAYEIQLRTQGDTLARLVDLCADVDRAHIQEKHSTTIPCRIKQ